MLLSALVAGALAVQPIQDAKPEKAPVVLARVVPKDAFFLVQGSRLDALRADFEAGAWYGFYQDEEMKGLREWLEKELSHEETDGKEKGLDLDPWRVFQSIHGSFAAFGTISPGQKKPAIGILVDPGEPRGAFEDALAKITDHQKQTQIASSDTYAGVDLKVFEEKPREKSAEAEKPVQAKKKEAKADEDEDENEDEDAIEKTAGDHGDGFSHSAFFEVGGTACSIGGHSREEVLQLAHGIIDRLSGKDPSTGIDGSDLLAQARASVAKPGRIEAFLDLVKVIAMARVESPPDEKEEKLIQALGVDGLRWVYATGDIGKGEASSFDLAAKIPESGYLNEFIGFLGTIPREMAGLAPRASSAITLAQIDVWGLWQSIWKMVAKIDPDAAEKAKSQIDAGAAQFGGEDLEKSFLSQLDGRFMTFNVPVPEEEWKATLGAALPETKSGVVPATGNATLIGLRDVQAVSSFVEQVLKGVGVFEKVETEDFQGNRICKLAMGAGPGVQWAFTKKAGVVSQFPTALRAALRMDGADKKDSALEKESFKPLFDAHVGASVLGLASTAETLKGGLTAAMMMQGIVGMRAAMSRGKGDGAADDPMQHLPSSDSIDRHFKGTLVSTVSRAGGVFHVQVSSR